MNSEKITANADDVKNPCAERDAALARVSKLETDVELLDMYRSETVQLRKERDALKNERDALKSECKRLWTVIENSLNIIFSAYRP